MPKSDPPVPWKLSFRRVESVASRAAGAAATITEPFVAGRSGAGATATAAAGAGAGGAAVRATGEGAGGGGVGGRRIFSSAVAYTEATTPHWAHLSFVTLGAPQRGQVAAITAPPAAPAAPLAPTARRGRRGPARPPSARRYGPPRWPSPCASRGCTSAPRRRTRRPHTPSARRP